MRVEPRLDEVVNGKRGMMEGIRVVLEAKCLVSGVALMFAAMDALASLTRPVKVLETDRDHFIRWADSYLRPAESVGCSATDLYSARCGVLHTHSSGSRLQQHGEARHLIYEWRHGPDAGLAKPLPDGALVIQVEDLHEALI